MAEGDQGHAARINEIRACSKMKCQRIHRFNLERNDRRLGTPPANSYETIATGEMTMAKGQQRSNKEARKPKKAKVKTIAAAPSQKSGARGLESMEHLKNS
jgi:hypothetical protein